MKTPNLLFLLCSFLGPLAQSGSALRPDPAIQCGDCAAWNAPQEPFRVYGNTYYVGTAGLSAILITSDDGLVLLDGGLPQSAPLIDASVRKLGFQTGDIRFIVNSHEHFDHAGGIAALQRASGAVVAASAAGARALERGEPNTDDPQFAFGREENGYPAVARVRVVKDGEQLKVGDIALMAHYTPGHTPGSTTWSWRSCEDAQCLNVVYTDSMTAVSAPGFRFSGSASHPSIAESFRRSIAKVGELPCDILLAPHTSVFDMRRKLARRHERPDVNPFIDANACRTFAAQALKRLDERLAEERRPGL